MDLLKFVICSGLLLLVYRLFLVNEKMHRFNRFYLLFSLVFSLTVPFISIKANIADGAIYQQIIPQGTSSQTGLLVKQQSASANILPDPDFSWSLIGLALYALVTAVMLLRFAINLYSINRMINKNDVVIGNGNQLVLMDKDVTPHSFLKYIFINKADYHNGRIESEIICHEQTHVRQLHSVDVLLIELLQALCWLILLFHCTGERRSLITNF